MTRINDVVVVGNIGIDTNVYLQGQDIDFDVEANFTQNLDYIGQAGGYATRLYNALGLKTGFIGHVGEDANGVWIREALQAENVDIRGLGVDPAGTARSINFMYRDGRRKNFYDAKGHMDLKPDQALCRQIFKKAGWAHFNLANWARLLLPVARQEGLKIVCDLQDMVALDDDYRKDFITQADVLFFSSVNHSPLKVIDYLFAVSEVSLVVAGLGSEGALVASRKAVFEMPPPKLDSPIIDSNGAGDSLACGFMYGWLVEQFSIKDSLLLGQILARHTCSLKATTEHLMTKDQLMVQFERFR